MNADTAEIDCVKRAQRGDAEAIEALIGRYERLVSAYTDQLLEHIPEAEDVAQEVFLRAFQELHTLRDPARFAGWLKSIAWRECRGWVRAQQAARRVKKTLAETAPTAMYDPLFEDADPGDDPWLQQLERTLDELSEGKKVVLALFYLRGLSHEMIAGFLEVPVGTVKRRLFEARAAVAASAHAAGAGAGTATGTEDMDTAERRRFVAAVQRLLKPIVLKKEMES